MVTSRLGNRARDAIAGLLLDQLFGEPPTAIHPVAGFGRCMELVEAKLYRDSRTAGTAYETVAVALGYGAGRIAAEPITVATVVAGRELRRAAARVRDALVADDLDCARERVVALVGRDPSRLVHSELAAAVIESVAENTVDAVVAPVCWAVAAGAAGASVYRAVNTTDAMVGHRNPRYENFGWPAARLDDLANYVPARLTAGLVALVRPARSRAIGRAVRAQAPAHPSPNAGVAEAAFAAALGVELGGPLHYGERHEDRPRLGYGPRPTVADIDRALALAAQIELVIATLLSAIYLGTRTR